MLLRDFLLRIHLCRGIGIVGKSKIYDWLATRGFNDRKLPELSTLMAVAEIKPHNQAAFSAAYLQLMNNDHLVAQLVDGEKWVSIADPSYPANLKEAYAAPIVLFYRGNLALVTGQLLGIVGAREATNYSTIALKYLIPGTISNRMTIVSGLAKGVDTLAHQCAIANDGQTIAVIGTGLDIAYPRTNRYLQDQIATRYLLISEYPNKTRGYRSHFPERNRIIAGLVQSILVTEAKHHSGSLITANLALQNNRNVLAIPGPIHSPLSVGTNELIAAGAKPVLRAEDILEEFIS
ncbi:DNA processing protein DprA [Lentilactobacillus fungorum]|uniref:DNA processing protein DprA n=1 Tax=Lentilactobacillus fungorum TaxID=2201250 RepID=A0ABQ3VV60_9LACO|nr:DNA-processing protein DprA [Lentilactobacillus fungorum]GHP12770.1 DNA processing protein DprA [Lentilactobacillus fungorum]